MFRGRLIYPFLIGIAQLDLETSTYDPDFKETVVGSTSDRLGAAERAETMVQVPGQFGNPQTFMQLQEANTGNLAQNEFEILFHFRNLEELGLVEASTGTALIKVGDRLDAIYECCDGSLIQKMAAPVFCVRANPIFGLHMRRNLLSTLWKRRDAGGSG